METNPGGRYAVAIPAAESLYALLSDPRERARVDARGLPSAADEDPEDVEG